VTHHPIRFVLFETSHPGNVGAAARAIKTMGFHDLVLVRPSCDIGSEARARASGALDVLEGARIIDRLADAVADCGFVAGASARRRRLAWPELDARECAAAATAAARSRPAAIVFGPERAGLTNAETDLCNALLYIPANPEYNSLNLASAIQIVAYELRMVGRPGEPVAEPEAPWAGNADVELFYEHLERALTASGFLKPDNPRHLMRRLRRLFNRAGLDENELNIMRGILSALAPGSGERGR